jgi:hypothetical protein
MLMRSYLSDIKITADNRDNSIDLRIRNYRFDEILTYWIYWKPEDNDKIIRTLVRYILDELDYKPDIIYVNIFDDNYEIRKLKVNEDKYEYGLYKDNIRITDKTELSDIISIIIVMYFAESDLEA